MMSTLHLAWIIPLSYIAGMALMALLAAASDKEGK